MNTPMPEDAPLIRLDGLSKVFHTDEIETLAVADVHLEIPRGQYVCIAGPSGSGKTTLLNIIGGLDKPTNGSVVISGTDISRLSDNKLIEFRKNHLGFVFQAYNLIPVLTATENIEFVMLLQNRPAAERNERTNELLEAVGLSDKRNTRPAQLSGGQQQRVAVARALAPKPDFILADEPTANLDSKSTENLLDIMSRLNHEQGITFVFSTHDQRVIERAHRVISLVDGKIASDMQQHPVK